MLTATLLSIGVAFIAALVVYYKVFSDKAEPSKATKMRTQLFGAAAFFVTLGAISFVVNFFSLF